LILKLSFGGWFVLYSIRHRVPVRGKTPDCNGSLPSRKRAIGERWSWGMRSVAVRWGRAALSGLGACLRRVTQGCTLGWIRVAPVGARCHLTPYTWGWERV
jgi:hypothetical protein